MINKLKYEKDIERFAGYMSTKYSISKTSALTYLSRFFVKEFEKGHLISGQGSTPNHVYINLSGYSKAFLNDQNGNERIVRFVKPYESINLFKRETFENRETLAFQTVTDSVMLVAANSTIKQILGESPELVTLKQEILERLLSKNVERLYELLVLSHQDRYFQLKQREPDLENHVGLKNIASYLGITSVSLSRIRSRGPSEKLTTHHH